MLVIYSVDPESSCNHLPETLQEIEFIADLWKEDAYLVGNQFMRQVSFVGCMPFLRTDPEDGENICYVELSEPTSKPQFYAADLVRKPRCPECGKAVDVSFEDSVRVVCPECGSQSLLQELKWGSRVSCLTRQKISIYQIEKGDAAPSGEFLDILKNRTGMAWDYCFL